MEPDKIIAIVKEVGSRLADPEGITANEADRGAGPLSLADGYPGICLLFGELAEHFPEEGWDRAAKAYLSKMEGLASDDGLESFSLFCGAAGVGKAALALAHEGTLARVNEFLLKALPREISFCFSKLGDVEVQDYDVILGLSGVGRYLLHFIQEPQIKPLIEDILAYMVELAADVPVSCGEVPGWYIPGENVAGAESKEAYPNGYFDCGLSHGIAGPLALLSRALSYGVEVKGQREALKKIACWLEAWKQPRGMYWPCLVSLEENSAGSITVMNTRDAWCYGTPGIARALWLAGCALGDKELKNSAMEAFDGLFSRPEDTWKAISPTFCHGYAGLLHLAGLMYRDTGLERFSQYREWVGAKVMEYFNMDAPFGFYDYDVSHDGIKSMNKAGLLEGAAGVALALLAVVKPVKTGWDTVFLVR